MEWHHITGRTGYFIIGSSLIITYHLSDQELLIVDTGDRTITELPVFFDSLGVRIHTIVRTHLHVDHIMNNELLQHHYHCDIYAPLGEIEPAKNSKNYARSHGLPENTKIPAHLTAIGENIIPVDHEHLKLDIAGHTFQMLLLPGHSYDHMGIVTPDGVCCVGDALLSNTLISLAKMPFFQYIDLSLQAITNLRSLSYPYYALAHRCIVTQDEMPELISANLNKETLIREQILSFVSPTATDDEIIDAVYAHLHISEHSSIQTLVNRQTIQARIDYIKNLR